MYAKSLLMAALALGMGLGNGSVSPANASGNSQETAALSTIGAFVCNAQPEFPVGLEELSSGDVKRSLANHLAKVGVTGADINVLVTEDETYYVQVTHANIPSVTELVVDPATTQILDLRVFADLPASISDAQSGQGNLQKVGYQHQLRSHMLGDGKTWANWVGSMDSRIICGDDYSQGGPDIKG